MILQFFSIISLFSLCYAAFPCDEDYSCINESITSINSSIYIRGYNAVSGIDASVTSKNNSIQILSSKGAKDSSLIKSSHVNCYGDHSCSGMKNYILATAQSGQIDCRGTSACADSYMISNGTLKPGIDCRADQSCSNSILVTGGGLNTIQARGAYSIINSKIYANPNATVVLRVYGYLAGYNATLFCSHPGTTCEIECDGNGCKNFIFNCSNGAECDISSCDGFDSIDCPIFSFDYNTNSDYEDMIDGISNISDYIGNETNIKYFDAARVIELQDRQCNEQTTSITVDDYNDRYEVSKNLDLTTEISDSNVCCRAFQGCRYADIIATYDSDSSIVCSSTVGCANTDLIATYGERSNVYCTGMESCRQVATVIALNNTVFCSGYLACISTNIYGANKVYCNGGYATCHSVKIYGTSNIYILAGSYRNVYNTAIYSNYSSISDNININDSIVNKMYVYIGADITYENLMVDIYCSENDYCFIECATNGACARGWYVESSIASDNLINLYCYGKCAVYCDPEIGIFCPNVTSIYGGTAIFINDSSLYFYNDICDVFPSSISTFCTSGSTIDDEDDDDDNITDDDHNNNDNGYDDEMVIMYAVIAGCAFILTIILVLCCYLIKSRNFKRQKQEKNNGKKQNSNLSQEASRSNKIMAVSGRSNSQSQDDDDDELDGIDGSIVLSLPAKSVTSLKCHNSSSINTNSQDQIEGLQNVDHNNNNNNDNSQMQVKKQLSHASSAMTNDEQEGVLAINSMHMSPSSDTNALEDMFGKYGDNDNNNNYQYDYDYDNNNNDNYDNDGNYNSTNAVPRSKGIKMTKYNSSRGGKKTNGRVTNHPNDQNKQNQIDKVNHEQNSKSQMVQSVKETTRPSTSKG